MRKALEGADVEAIKSATEALMAASQEMGQKMYESAAAADRADSSSASDSEASAPSDDDVVEAEIVEDDDSEKA